MGLTLAHSLQEAEKRPTRVTEGGTIMDTETSLSNQPQNLGQLASSVHSAQAQGLLRQPEAVANLLAGISGALRRTVQDNARDPRAAWALRSDVYWDHFEMHIKEALLTSFSGLDPSLCGAVREQIEDTLSELKRHYRCS